MQEKIIKKEIADKVNVWIKIEKDDVHINLSKDGGHEEFIAVENVKGIYKVTDSSVTTCGYDKSEDVLATNIVKIYKEKIFEILKKHFSEEKVAKIKRAMVDYCSERNPWMDDETDTYKP